jgi:hypothetical protein
MTAVLELVPEPTDLPEGFEGWPPSARFDWLNDPTLGMEERMRRGRLWMNQSTGASRPATPHSYAADWLANAVTADSWDAVAPPAPPAVCKIEGTTGALFSAGRVSRLFGSSGSAKSWIAKLGTLEVLTSGGAVLYLDCDGVFEDFRAHMKALGLSRDDALSGRLHYIRVEGSLLGDDFKMLLDGQPWDFIVIDGFNVALNASGFKGAEDDGVTAFFGAVLNPAADTGAAVLVIDHMKKDGETDHGSVFKRNNLTGTDYSIRRKSLIAPGIRGYSALALTPKDRPGWATSLHASRGKTQDDPFAYVVVDSTGDGGGPATTVTLQLDAPFDVMLASAMSQANSDADTLRALLRDNPGGFSSNAKVRAALKARGKDMDTTRINDAGKLLVQAGEITRSRVGQAVDMRPVVQGVQP